MLIDIMFATVMVFFLELKLKAPKVKTSKTQNFLAKRKIY